MAKNAPFDLPEKVRKILVSVKFVSAILGPEMAAPILWTPGKNASVLQENLHVRKIPRFRGGGILGLGGGGKGRFYIFMGARIFLRKVSKTQRGIKTDGFQNRKFVEFLKPGMSFRSYYFFGVR